MRPASLAGPVRPALVSIQRVGLGEDSSPRNWGFQGGALLNPLEEQPDRLRSAISACASASKTDGSQSLKLHASHLRTLARRRLAQILRNLRGRQVIPATAGGEERIGGAA